MAEGIRILSAGAVKRGVAQIAAAFERETGMRVSIDFAPVPEVRRRVAGGEAPDVIIATPQALDECAAVLGIHPDRRGVIGRSRMGVVVHADAPIPPLNDTEAFKRLLLSASAVVRNEASSGLYAARLIDELELASALQSRLVVVKTGAAIMEYVAEHPTDAVGIAQISEVMVMIDKGCRVRLAGPLPAGIQKETTYEAAAVGSSDAPAAAGLLVSRLTDAAAKSAFAATGIS